MSHTTSLVASTCKLFPCLAPQGSGQLALGSCSCTRSVAAPYHYFISVLCMRSAYVMRGSHEMVCSRKLQPPTLCCMRSLPQTGCVIPGLRIYPLPATAFAAITTARRLLLPASSSPHTLPPTDAGTLYAQYAQSFLLLLLLLVFPCLGPAMWGTDHPNRKKFQLPLRLLLATIAARFRLFQGKCSRVRASAWRCPQCQHPCCWGELVSTLGVR